MAGIVSSADVAGGGRWALNVSVLVSVLRLLGDGFPFIPHPGAVTGESLLGGDEEFRGLCDRASRAQLGDVLARGIGPRAPGPGSVM